MEEKGLGFDAVKGEAVSSHADNTSSSSSSSGTDGSAGRRSAVKERALKAFETFPSPFTDIIKATPPEVGAAASCCAVERWLLCFTALLGSCEHCRSSNTLRVRTGVVVRACSSSGALTSHTFAASSASVVIHAVRMVSVPFTDTIRQLPQTATNQAITEHGLYQRTPDQIPDDKWGEGMVTLVGDAAHTAYVDGTGLALSLGEYDGWQIAGWDAWCRCQATLGQYSGCCSQSNQQLWRTELKHSPAHTFTFCPVPGVLLLSSTAHRGRCCAGLACAAAGPDRGSAEGV